MLDYESYKGITFFICEVVMCQLMMIKLPVNPLNDGLMTPYVDPEIAETISVGFSTDRFETYFPEIYFRII